MPLSTLHRRALANYREYRSKGGPTMLGLVRKSLKQYLTILILCAAAVGVVALHNDRASLIVNGFLIGGVYLGYVARDIGTNHAFIRLWPLLDQVFDWRRIDELLDRSDQ
jgi:hypothetical protein